MRGKHRWRSIDRTLPLLILCLESGTIAALTLTSFQRVEKIMLATAGERLQSATAPVALLLAQSAAHSKAQLGQIAADPALIHYLLTGRGGVAARAAMARGWAGEPHPHGRLELRRTDGTAALDTTIGRGGPLGTPWVDGLIRRRTLAPGTTEIGPFATVGDSTVSQVVAVVSSPPATTVEGSQDDGDGSTTVPQIIGYLVDVSYLSTTGAQTVRDLIGTHVTLLLGSFQQGEWTDLEHPAAPPPPGAELGRPIVFGRSPRGPGVGAATPVQGTPWMVWVEQPRSVVLAVMHPVVMQLAVLAAVFLVVGAGIAWVLSRRITRPIVALTEAAERISPTSPDAPEVSGQNEIARLADAFHRMAARVAETQEDLESRVRARTLELHEAMTSLEETQEQLVQKERLAMLGQVASAVGHELRNPLGVMTNALYVIDSSLRDAPPMVREYIGLLRGQIGISERIIGDLLDTARSRPPQIADVELSSHVERQLARLGPLTDVQVRLDFPAALPSASFDPDQLAQIVLNLVSNAAQAMTDSTGGRLTIAGYTEKGGRVCLSVSDTGSGMAPDVLGRIFEPLFTTKARGMGLGLWVSRSLARANGAELTATSQPGRGSRFVLTMAQGARQAAVA